MMLYRDPTRTSIICFHPPRINSLRIGPTSTMLLRINPLRTISTRIYPICINPIRIGPIFINFIRINSTRINPLCINLILINLISINPIIINPTQILTIRANRLGRQRVTALNPPWAARKSFFRPQPSRIGCQRVRLMLGRRTSRVIWDMTIRNGIFPRQANLERASLERAGLLATQHGCGYSRSVNDYAFFLRKNMLHPPAPHFSLGMFTVRSCPATLYVRNGRRCHNTLYLSGSIHSKWGEAFEYRREESSMPVRRVVYKVCISKRWLGH
jgi:hypothetical protein